MLGPDFYSFRAAADHAESHLNSTFNSHLSAVSASTYVWGMDSRVHGLTRFPLSSASESSDSL